MKSYKIHVERVLGEVADRKIKAYLPTQYMYLGHHGGTPQFNPVPDDAGFLAASVHSYQANEDLVIVTSDPVTYGAWIEGISDLNAIVWPHRRNPPPRRFPGYHTFQIIAQELQVEAATRATAELPYYIGELNA
jgi:hypothetical protein